MREISMTSRTVDIAALELSELENTLQSREIEPFHARQLYRWIYRRGITDFDRMTDLSRTLRAQFAEDFIISTPRIVSDERSADDTRSSAEEHTAGLQTQSNSVCRPLREKTTDRASLTTRE